MSWLDGTTIVPAFKGKFWSYQPRPPFKVQRWHVLGIPMLAHWSDTETLEGALNMLAMQYLPVEQGFCVEIVDDNLVGIFGISKLTGLAEMMGAAWGVEVAFQTAEQLGDIDQVSLAIWEMNARKQAPGG